MHPKHPKAIRFLIAGAILILGCTVAAFTASHIRAGKDGSEAKGGESVSTVSPADHETIKASVLSDNPSAYKIDVKKFANMGVNEEAPTFAIYITENVPARCGDFRNLALPYKKPTKYERQFDLSEHTEVLAALDRYGCVVMRNIPPSAG